MAVKIIEYSDKYKSDFLKINTEWLEDMFVVEPYDFEILSNPEKYILNEGGNIWFAIDEDLKALGSCALMPHQDNHLELTKMGVLKSARGTGAGRLLLDFTIKKAKELKPQSLFLLTNKKCEAAIHLYYKYGFVESKEIQKKYGAAYERCDFGMIYPNL